jgi:hypothetical protein
MRISVRPKLGIILSLVTILMVTSSFLVISISSRGSGAHAASVAGASNQVSGTLAAQTLKLGGQQPVQAASQTIYAAPAHFGKQNVNAATTAARKALVANGPSVQNGSATTVLHNFSGLSGLDTATIAGIRVHPPDQGMCVGHDASIAGNPEVVFELINLVVAQYNTSGVVQKSALMPSGKESLNAFFNEPGIPFLGGELTSDPRCIFNQPTDTFFFSTLAFCAPIFGCPGTAVESHQDLIVYNATSGKATEYKFDSSFPTHVGCPCLGDQPKIGVDNNAIYLSVDEYQDLAAGGTIENGADVFIFSKPQLVAQTAVNFTVFTQLTLSGFPVTSLQPAISTSSTDTEFLANSFPFLDALGIIPNPVANTLGFWKVTGDSNVTTGNFNAVIMAGKVITSESYFFPVPALSSGLGTPRSSAFLNPDDSRLQQCQFVSGNTWCALTTAINIKNDSATRDGVAWFKLSTTGNIAAQGYVASIGNYLIYPAIIHSASGSTGIVFTLTSGSINPSAAFAFAGSGTAFGGVRIAARGAAPSTDGAVRWGDYSAAALDLNGKDLWMATEYVPSGFTDPRINYGTRVFAVA